MTSPYQYPVPQAPPEMPQYCVVYYESTPCIKGSNVQTEACTFSYPDRIVPSCGNSVTSFYLTLLSFPSEGEEGLAWEMQ